MFVIKCTERRRGGQFVAVTGYQSSYTNTAKHIRKFAAREEAERHRCVENEIVVKYEDLIY